MNNFTQDVNFETIFMVVSQFYDKARRDPIIGHFFQHISDFTEHEQRIAAFWWFALGGKADGLAFTPPRFDMINKHLALGIKDKDLEQWLRLFKQTLADHLDESTSRIWSTKLDEIARQIKRMVIDQQPIGIQIRDPG